MSDVVFSEHLAEALTAVKQYTLSELLILSQAINAEISNLQGSASYAVFTGATSDTGGASGIVPAPQAGDDDKFLCGNGQWVTLQSGGGSYPIATSLEAGLMSAEDKQHLDSVFQSSANFAGAVLTGVGGKFVPEVRSVTDYMTYQDSNIQYFDSKLYNILRRNNYTLPKHGTSVSFLDGQTTLSVSIGSTNSTNSLYSSMYGNITFGGTNSSTQSVTAAQIYKCSEQHGFIHHYLKNSTNNKNETSRCSFFTVADTGQVSLSSSPTKISSSSIGSGINNETYIIRSLCNNEVYYFVNAAQDDSTHTKTWTLRGYSIFTNGIYPVSSSSTTIGKEYLTGSDKTNVTNSQIATSSISLYEPSTGYFWLPYNFYPYKPSGSSYYYLDKSQANVNWYNYPLFFVREAKYDSSGNTSDSNINYYLYCLHGRNKVSSLYTPCKILVYNKETRYTKTMNGKNFLFNQIAGVYPSRSCNRCYIVTLNGLTAPTIAELMQPDKLNQIFEIWHMDPEKGDLTLSPKTFTEILPDLII